MRETSSQLQQMSIRQRQEHEWKAFKLVIFEEKSLSLKELATLFLRSEAKCVTFPYIKILLTIAMQKAEHTGQKRRKLLHSSALSTEENHVAREGVTYEPGGF